MDYALWAWCIMNIMHYEFYEIIPVTRLKVIDHIKFSLSCCQYHCWKPERKPHWIKLNVCTRFLILKKILRHVKICAYSSPNESTAGWISVVVRSSVNCFLNISINIRFGLKVHMRFGNLSSGTIFSSLEQLKIILFSWEILSR